MKLQVQTLVKSYGPVAALRGVSLELRDGEVHALCGHNGAGKSTLVKILSGVEQPDEGVLEINGEPISFRNPLDAQAAGIALVDQELSLVPQLTVAENIDLGRAGASFITRPGRARPRVKQLLGRVGLGHISPSTPVELLSIGERQLVEIARGLGREAGLLILDEPTATLSDTEIAFVFNAVRDVAAEGASIVFVSHRLGEVLSLCNVVTVLRDGELVATKPIAEVDRPTLIEMMVGSVVDADTSELRPSSGKIVTVSSLQVPPRVTGVDLQLEGGQIMGIAGQVGCGASEVLRALGGLVPQAAGDVSIAGKKVRINTPRGALASGVSYISGDRKGDGLFLNRSVSDNLIATRLGDLSQAGIMQPRAAARTAKELAEVAGIDPSRLRSAVVELSGGNQQKVFLGRCLDRKGTELLILDEPTRGVDVGGRAEIHNLIRRAAAAGHAVIFASTELTEILDLSDIIVTMFGGQVVSTRQRSEVTAASALAEITHRDSDAKAVA